VNTRLTPNNRRSHRFETSSASGQVDLRAILATSLDPSVKGIPSTAGSFKLRDIRRKRWNVVREDLPFPLLVVKECALKNNLQVMKQYLDAHGVSFAPHGKTYMAPQLFAMQLEAGAWGITAATVNQVQVYRRFGIQRVLLANQLVGPQHIKFIIQELNRDREFDFYCIVDSVESVEHLGAHARCYHSRRPIKVLLEGGYQGGRTGCRTINAAIRVVQALRRERDVLCLAGVEGFEGLIMGNDPTEITETRVNEYLDFLIKLLLIIKPSDMPGATEFILSAGGSAHFDLVVNAFSRVKAFLRTRIVLRSGCYLAHDSEMYEHFQQQRHKRGWEGDLRPAIEVWSYVQSLPEPGLAILSMGKRDCPYDYRLPTPVRVYRGLSGRDLAGCQITELNDQHAYLRYDGRADFKIGDKVVSGISHPCTAFDKWRFIPVVSEDYDVINGLLTFF
jgi:D-serine dehydratase